MPHSIRLRPSLSRSIILIRLRMRRKLPSVPLGMSLRSSNPKSAGTSSRAIFPSPLASNFASRSGHLGRSFTTLWPGSPCPPFSTNNSPSPATAVVMGICGNPATDQRSAPSRGSYATTRPVPSTINSLAPSWSQSIGVDQLALRSGRGVRHACLPVFRSTAKTEESTASLSRTRTTFPATTMGDVPVPNRFCGVGTGTFQSSAPPWS